MLDFFNKNWKRLAGPEATPKVALIDRQMVDTNDDWITDDIKESAADAIKVTGIMDGNKDTDRVISPEHFVIVDLPTYNAVHPEF